MISTTSKSVWNCSGRRNTAANKQLDALGPEHVDWMTRPVTWVQLSFDSPPGIDLEACEQALLELGAASVTLTDAADEPVLEPGPGQTPTWKKTRVSGLFSADCELQPIIDELQRRTGLESLPDLRVEALEERVWEREWMNHFRPMRFGERLWVVPDGTEPPDPTGVNLRFDPGLAFGTGTHATTALCLQWLDRHPPRDRDVIDFGCGSGILAVAAARLGARHVWAVDNDPQALTATRDNARKNDVADRISVEDADEARLPSVDLLLANILLSPLLSLAPQFSRQVRPGGRIVLSGVLEEQVSELSSVYTTWFELAPATGLDGWACLEGRRK